MPAADASAICSKCERPLNARMTREGDRARTYWECPVCDQDGEGSSDRPTQPLRPGAGLSRHASRSRHCAAAATPRAAARLKSGYPIPSRPAPPSAREACQ